MDGILIVNKPSGITSHDVVDFVRRKLKIKKVGHAGTLDPMATGVLVVLVGRCTKLFDRFLDFEKEYAATLTFGVQTDTGDSQGRQIRTAPWEHITAGMVEETFGRFQGEILQTPPMYSAVKHQGKPLYKLANKGKHVDRQPRPITIHQLRMLSCDLPHVRFYLKCSKGTYVRQLAEDVAAQLHSAGHISQLERQSIGPFRIQESLALEQVEENKIRPFYNFCLSL
ncbi:MAG TPA: tRNA pseudouridine(55) synthase TruB [Candidatus Omnitrophota bacterium]|nr:tRNA pseudouridine(55) synthase TruB [Candidatus Omnitrophota bacterium]